MKHRCPICKQKIKNTSKPQPDERKYFPFCSQRCKLIDLGDWLDSNYKIFSNPSQKPDEQIQTKQKIEN